MRFAEGAEEPFDLLVIADGVHSAARESLAAAGRLSVSQTPDELQYKVVTLPPPSAAGASPEHDRSFHTWPGTQPVTMLAPPNPDRTLSGIIILPKKGEWTWESVDSVGRVRELFKTHFADAFGGQEIPESEAAALVEQRAATGGYTTVCSSLHVGDSVVLLGDAAHSCLASFGQASQPSLLGPSFAARPLSRLPSGGRTSACSSS